MRQELGIDIVKNSRIKINYNFLIKFLTKTELKMMENFTSKKRKKEFAAGRWAAKEAIFKVLKTTKKINLNEIELGYDNNKLLIKNKNLSNIVVSLSHEKKYSIAIASWIGD
ncbi:holo-[acyl-carrier-protein] synthase [Williamsoniiplasma somnilux]|uniref:Holo-[acyl-carrier-protein] synthase n=1 Tax=Williamsoniiplasma somnilux TaxID=215578 RepID=A0A2K8NY14_9MOLU|nr:4'-phosphopantetheinyl transferase superfamily protein [Williamsoniiplasma somnilux]ATZ18677.1 holo-[acyl-carrier-protein] synthase [Williamsoniiplasma somnilux]